MSDEIITKQDDRIIIIDNDFTEDRLCVLNKGGWFEFTADDGSRMSYGEINLSVDNARTLANWLLARADEMKKKGQSK